ncbi:MAG: 30S ribosomal protein S17 [Planctomycetes bacterium]|nr:30S ribosomal protein S17 [Planctomycetota bacterium]
MAEEKKTATAPVELKRTVVGVVISSAMTKTITVRAERMIKHPQFGKYLRRYTKFKAHDESGQAKTGDRVEIVATRPISKTKHWSLLRVIEKGEAALAAAAPAAK